METNPAVAAVDLLTADLELTCSIRDGFATAITVAGQPRPFALCRQYADAVHLMAIIDKAKSSEARAEPLAADGDADKLRAGEIDPVIYEAMVRSHRSIRVIALLEAAKALLDACYLADAGEELPEQIDGSLLDALSEALARLSTMEAGA